jgi:hypothetical protein
MASSPTSKTNDTSSDIIKKIKYVAKLTNGKNKKNMEISYVQPLFLQELKA